ncbi:ROK family protein [Paenibacillus hodogayensis]|uniref:ROK family protein n=1 Tax=Paenibacillus hodogayensis TaxID=279208 RepID=A0ABV5VYI9_9BACL
MNQIAVDFGGTNVKIGYVREGRIVAFGSIPAHSALGLLPRMKEVERVIRELGRNGSIPLEACGGIGIALPGVVDTKARKLLAIHEKYADAYGFPFEEWAAEAFSLPLVMENDARAALIGETSWGSARGERDAVLVIFGTGIGTAAMIDGKVLRGKHGQAGILGGHFSVASRGPVCNCGNTGCVEELASHRTLLVRAREEEGFSSSPLAALPDWGYAELIRSWREGDPFAKKFVERLTEYWSAGIVNLIHAYDPETVIVSGGLMKSADVLLPLLRDAVMDKVWKAWGSVRFTVAADPESSVLLGLARLSEDAVTNRGMKEDERI